MSVKHFVVLLMIVYLTAALLVTLYVIVAKT